eukprot:c8680_g1_i2.p1 GENE.c8680_g1_i2~~c8680_g1_i2.p1  ORF type:complete len:612 (+),score=133.42 c8680_g1_i2:323-2158(+)
MAIVPQRTSLVPHNDQFMLLMVNDNNENPLQVGTQFLLTAIDISSVRSRDSVGFPWGDINILMLTDVHSWVSSHFRPDNSPLLTADMGDVLSLIEHLQSDAAARGTDLFIVDNGDIVDGTGVSDATAVRGVALFPLLKELPYDALNIGNHELYSEATIRGILEPNGYADHFRGKYLTSNVILSDTKQPIGIRSSVLVGSRTGTRLVAFGFLYNMLDASPAVTVLPVQEVVQTEWFVAALQQDVQAVLVLAHMDLQNDLLFVILEKIREVKGSTFPVLFVTGHSHYRGFAQFDSHAVSIEAGRFLDTVGFASITLTPEKVITSHRFVTANADELARVTEVSRHSFVTENGSRLKSMIQKVRQELELDRVVGCSPQHYFVGTQLWQLYSQNIVPRMLDFDNSTILLMRTTGIRYDLFEGVVTTDDLLCVFPFPNRFMIIVGLNGSMIRELVPSLSISFRLSVELTSLEASSLYRVVIQDFDRSSITTTLTRLGTQDYAVSNVDTEYTTSSIWKGFVSQHWPCPESPTPTSSPSPSVLVSESPSSRDSRSQPQTIIVAVVVSVLAFGIIALGCLWSIQRCKKTTGLLSHQAREHELSHVGELHHGQPSHVGEQA